MIQAIIIKGEIMKDIKILLGKRIKELRKKMNISQQELAAIINIDPRNLSNIECGISFPSKVLLEISKALKVSLAELFDFEHQKYTISDMKNYILTELDNISEDSIITIYRFIKALR